MIAGNGQRREFKGPRLMDHRRWSPVARWQRPVRTPAELTVSPFGQFHRRFHTAGRDCSTAFCWSPITFSRRRRIPAPRTAPRQRPGKGTKRPQQTAGALLRHPNLFSTPQERPWGAPETTSQPPSVTLQRLSLLSNRRRPPPNRRLLPHEYNAVSGHPFSFFCFSRADTNVVRRVPCVCPSETKYAAEPVFQFFFWRIPAKQVLLLPRWRSTTGSC
mmetsp:Transcript_95262/g.160023  ORF Transcript_95262/g.160023 Transcript_95262/m.160023 type:complete len:217 (+) Transcript_95262:519-1169(+)